MRILVINNDGGGFADYIEVAEETTVQELFEQQVDSIRPFPRLNGKVNS